MKINRKFFIFIMIMLIALVCFGAVSAANTLDTNLTSEDATEIAASDSVEEVVASDSASEALTIDDSSEVLSANGDILYVDCNYEGTTESGTQDAPFKTIKKAADAATGGETIFIKNGIYDKNYQDGNYAKKNDCIGTSITKALNVVGESRGGVIVKATSSSFGFVSTKSDLNLTNLTFVIQPSVNNQYSTAATNVIQGGSGATGYLNVINCSIVNSTIMKFFVSQSTGDVVFDNLIMYNNSFVNSATMFEDSGVKNLVLKNSLIINNYFKRFGSTDKINSLIDIKKASTWTLDNVTISNNNITTQKLFIEATAGSTLNIVNSKFKNNTIIPSSTTNPYIFYAAGSSSSGYGKINIQQSVISNNNVAYIFAKGAGSASVVANYNNINNNTLSKSITLSNQGAYNLDANWWGSNDAPSNTELGIVSSAWALNSYAIDNGDYVYTLNNGSELEKMIPELPGFEPIGSSVVIDPINAVTYPEDVLVTYTVENETVVSIVVKDSSNNEITTGVDVSLAGQVLISDLLPGDYTITITNAEQGRIESSTASAGFTVNPIGSWVAIDPIYSVNYPYSVYVYYTVVNETDVSVVVKDEDENEITEGVDTSVSGEVAISNLAPGNYTITITNLGSETISSSSYSANFSVMKANSGVYVNDIEDGTYKYDVVVDFSIGNITQYYIEVFSVDDNGDSSLVFTTNESLSSQEPVEPYVIDTLGTGKFFVRVTNIENDYYFGSVYESNIFTIFKANSSIAIDTIYGDQYGSPILFTLIVENQTTINAVVKDENGNNVSCDIEFDGDNFTVSGLNPGLYFITVTNEESDLYNESSCYSAFSIVKAKSNVVIDPIEYLNYYGSDIVVNYTVENKTNISVILKRDGVEVTSGIDTSVDGKVILSDLGCGEYTIVINNEENDLYLNSSAESNFAVAPAGSTLVVISVEGLNYGQSVLIGVKIINASGIIVDLRDSENNTITEGIETSIVGEEGTVTLSGLVPDEYTLTLTADVDENHTAACCQDYTVIVCRALSSLAITSSEIGSYGVDSIFNFTVDNKTTISAVVNDTYGNPIDYNISIGDNGVIVSGLVPGDYVITVTNDLSDLYWDSHDSFYFTVIPSGSSVVIGDIENGVYGSDVVGTYAVENETTLSAVVKDSNGEEVTCDIVLNEGTIAISGLVPGNYTLNITNAETELYGGSSDEAPIVVDKAGSSVVIDSVEMVPSDRGAIVNYTVVNQTEIGVVVSDSEGYPITEGVDTSVAGQVSISGLAKGDYLVIIYNAESDLYATSNASAMISIVKTDTSFIFDERVLVYDDDSHLVISLVDVDGNYVANATIHIDNTLNVTDYVTDSFGVISVPIDLNAGEYNFTVTYDGNDSYEGVSAERIVVVTKMDTVVSAEDVALTYNESVKYDVALNDINGKAIANATVKVTIGDDVYTNVTDADGVCSVELSGLAVGTQTIVVSYEGDDNYAESSADYTLTVNKITPEIDVTASAVVYGEDLVVKVASDADLAYRVVVTVDGQSKLLRLKDGKGTVKFSGLAIGSYNVTADYKGDSIYAPASDSVIVDVIKNTPNNFAVTAEDVYYGNDLVVRVSSDDELAYRVNVTVGDQSKLLRLNNGVGTVKFSGLDVGTYTVTALYKGDANFSPVSVDTTAEVMKPVPLNFVVSADDVLYGEDLVVTVTSDANLAYRVNVTVGDQSKLLRLKDGKGTLRFSGLDVGSYSVTALYKGDANYSAVSADASVKVLNPVPNNLVVSANAVYCGEDLVVTVNCDDELAYRINVTVGNESKLLRLKDGKGTLRFSGLGVGTYTVTALYKGDANFSPASVSTVAEVMKPMPTNFTVSADDINAGEDLVVTVNSGDALAYRVNVTVGNQSKLLRLKDGKGTVRFSGLEAGDYTVVALYKGDENYSPISADASVKVN